MDAYNVKGGVVDTSDRESGAEGVAKAVVRGVSEFSTYKNEFTRGQVYLTETGVIYIPSPNESTIKNTIDVALSKGPVNPLRLFGFYDPYATELPNATSQEGAWAVPYADIDALSLLSKNSGNELFIRTTDNDDILYRIRNMTGTDYIGFYRQNRKYAKRLSGDIYTLASKQGGVEEFDAGSRFSVYTKQREIPKTNQVSHETLPRTPTGVFKNAEPPTETSITETDTETPVSPDTADSAESRSRSVEQSPSGEKPMWLVALPIFFALVAPTAFALSPFLGNSAEFGTTIYGAILYTIISQWGGIVIVYGMLINSLSLPFYVISPYAILAVNSLIYLTLIIDVTHVRRRTDWKPRLRYYLPGTLLAWFITIPVYLYRRYKVSKRYVSTSE